MSLRLSLSLLFIAIIWISVSLWVGWYATPLIHPDGFQSIGASFGENFGKLCWPFVDNFEGFGDHWGYHWFGWPLIRSIVSGVFSFSPWYDALFLHCVRALTAFLVAASVWRSYGLVGATVAAFLTILLQKGWFCSMAFLYRPETMGALLLWLAAEPLWSNRHQTGWKSIISVFALVACPMMHPLSLVASFWLALLGIARGRIFAGRSWRCLLTRWILPCFLGLAFFIWYYACDNVAYDQLMNTLHTMHEVRMNYVDVLRNMFFAPNNIFFVWPASILLILALVAIGQKWITHQAVFGLLASCSILLLGFAYLIVGGHPNVGHASILTPFFGLLAAQVFLIRIPGMNIRAAMNIGMATLILFCLIPLSMVVCAYVQSPPISHRGRAAEILESALAQTQGRVLIPMSLWEAALMQKPEVRSRIRFSTFPNYAGVKRRQIYENEMVESLRQGDILIIAPLPEDLHQAGELMPWPRHLAYADKNFWIPVASYEPIHSMTISIGSFRKSDLVLDKLTVFRYQYP